MEISILSPKLPGDSFRMLFPRRRALRNWLASGLAVRRLRVAVAFALAIAGLPAQALSLAPLESYTVKSPDGTYIFVMLLPAGPGTDELREKYSVSGLYKNDGSRELVWSVDWYALWAVVASDGKHVVVGPLRGPALDEYDGNLVTFVANGKSIRGYGFEQLLGDSGSFLADRWFTHSKLDDANRIWEAATVNGRWYEFDLTTGDIRFSFHLRPWFFASAILLSVVVLVLAFRRRSLVGHYAALGALSVLWTFGTLLCVGRLDAPVVIVSSIVLVVLASGAILLSGLYQMFRERPMPGTYGLMWALWLPGTAYIVLSLLYPPW